MQVTQDKKRYPLLNHYRYTFHKLKEKSGSGALAVCAGDVMLSVLLPFLEAALAGAVAACLVSGKRPQEILLMILGYVVILQEAGRDIGAGGGVYRIAAGGQIFAEPF